MLIFTICARNYLAYAMTLRDSVRLYQPDADFLIFLADGPVDAPGVEDTIVPLEQLGIPGLRDMCFRYTLMELSTAIKPFCFEYVFDHLDVSAAVYLDPDIEMFARLDAVSAAFDEGASCVLTPHILEPLTDDRRPNDLDILNSGTFNLGFAAFANVPEARKFLKWWGRKLQTECYADLSRGLFVDQKFMDFAPSFLPGLTVLRHPGYNVAYWNLSHRPLFRIGNALSVHGHPLVFFHFSGVVPADPDVFSKHQNRFDRTSAGAAGTLAAEYAGKLLANQHARWSATPYAFGTYDDGTPIPAPVRRKPIPEGGGATAFERFDAVYWSAPSLDLDQSPHAPITRLMQAIHAARPDLQSAFPLTSAAGRALFHAWFIAHGRTEYALNNSVLPDGGAAFGPLARFFAKVRLGFLR